MEPAWVDVCPPPKVKERYWLYTLLFVLTLASTLLTGAEQWAAFQADFGVPVIDFASLGFWLPGLWYALTILAILGAHEAGHYVACRYYGIDASWPYFLPLPISMTGTAGAFIRIRTPIYSKRQMFDVGVAGPLAGFVVAVPALVIGLKLSRVVALPPDFSGFELGEPLLFQWCAAWVWGTPGPGMTINMHPMAFAAWFGLLATAMNLIPMGQFDGGHIAYAVLGRRAAWVTLGAVGTAVALCFYSTSWVVWTLLAVAILYKFGWRHPATWDESIPLDRGRTLVALLAVLIFLACFTPAPVSPLDLVGAR